MEQKNSISDGKKTSDGQQTETTSEKTSTKKTQTPKKIGKLNQHVNLLGEAVHDIPRGQLIMSEKPILVAVDSHYISSVCACCLQIDQTTKQLYGIHSNAIICKSCKKITYCSEECQKKDRSIHQVECEWLSEFDGIPCTYSRVIGRFIIKYLMDLVKPNEIMSRLSEFRLIAFMKTVVPRQPNNLAENLIKYLPPTMFGNILPAIIDYIITAVEENCFQIYNYLEETIAIGVYKQCGFFNHCCYPNADIVVWNGGEIFYYSRLDIKQGTIITISYVDCLLPLLYRVNILYKVYDIFCMCSVCKLELNSLMAFDPTVKSLQSLLKSKTPGNKILYEFNRSLFKAGNNAHQILLRILRIQHSADTNPYSGNEKYMFCAAVLKEAFRNRCYTLVVDSFNYLKSIILESFPQYHSTSRLVNMYITVMSMYRNKDFQDARELFEEIESFVSTWGQKKRMIPKFILSIKEKLDKKAQEEVEETPLEIPEQQS